MSDAHNPPQPPPVPAPEGTEPSTQAPAKSRKLPVFLKTSIVLLIGLTLLAIVMLFIDDIDGKFERVLSTVVLFVVFVILTGIDTVREKTSEWYAPVALIANAYILALLLAVIWGTPYDSFTLIGEIFWKSIVVILTVRVVMICCEVLIRSGERSRESVARFAFVTSVLAVLTGIMFTAPVGIDAFGLHIPDLYWRIAVAVLILTALGLSITLLLRWAYGSEERAARRAAAQAQYAVQQPYYAVQPPYVAQPHVVAQPPYVAQEQVAGQESASALVPPASEPSPVETEGLLPWPRYEDGSPLPVGPDGQPDFSAPAPGQSPN